MNKKILIVEDNPVNMKLVKKALSAQHYTLLNATDGEQALRITKREQPDLIIMDIQLPRIDGLEVTRRLKHIPAFRQIPIIAVSSYTMKGDRERFIEAGCDAYMSKPINSHELQAMIVNILP